MQVLDVINRSEPFLVAADHDFVGDADIGGRRSRALEARLDNGLGLPVHGDIEGEILGAVVDEGAVGPGVAGEDRKSTRLNSSHSQISYAVLCLKKKNYLYGFAQHTE